MNVGRVSKQDGPLAYLQRGGSTHLSHAARRGTRELCLNAGNSPTAATRACKRSQQILVSWQCLERGVCKRRAGSMHEGTGLCVRTLIGTLVRHI